MCEHVGVDVAKGSSVVQTFEKRNEPVDKAIVMALETGFNVELV